ncbi:MarR family winged helix-turn-helix transcriptional regulator [Actinomadura macra]|uniref:MarR family winged helix-turn-helix transcriptional regulator n=1 Tax=Actinomadura macra TaxID=46164 RepID=UPI0008352ABA|nr:MarR family winged helix-turn-helix transcriptional regulator [Actinomadura macra]
MQEQPDPLRDSPSYLLFELLRLARRTSARTFPGERVRLPHLMVLDCVARLGPLSQREVSEHLRIDAGDMVGMIDALEEAGYVERRRDAGDRRRYALDVTEAGRLFLGASHERRNRLDDLLFEPLALGELAQFKDLMLRVLAHHDPRFADQRSGRPPAPGPDRPSDRPHASR